MPPPQALARHEVGADDEAVLDHFRAALIARSIIPPDPIVADGRLRRCNAAGARGRGDAAYVLHLDGTPAGGFENWRDGLGWETWRHDSGLVATPAERQRLSRLSIAAKAARDEAARQRGDEHQATDQNGAALGSQRVDQHPGVVHGHTRCDAPHEESPTRHLVPRDESAAVVDLVRVVVYSARFVQISKLSRR